MSTDATRAAFLRGGGPGRLDIAHGYLVAQVDGCTCATPDATAYGHESECGWEPLMSLEAFRALPEQELAQILRTAGQPPAPDTSEDRMAQALLFCGELYEPQEGDGLVHAQELDHLLDQLTAAERDRLAVMAQLLRYEIQLRQRGATWSAAESVLAERGRQTARGYTAEHDDQWLAGEMRAAAECYLWAARMSARNPGELMMPIGWPEGWAWKPSPNPVRNLIKAAGLAAAEADRLHRVQKAQALREQVEHGS